MLRQKSMFWDKAIVGGPAVKLMPNYLKGIRDVTIGNKMDGVLQKINPYATRTTLGCPNKCKFCGIGEGLIEAGEFKELNDWPDLPIICDNNLLASSDEHFKRVIDRLVNWGWADFNQGLDTRLLSSFHAKQIARIKRPIIRLALDNMAYADQWVKAYEKIREVGIAKSRIRSYVLIGFKDGPIKSWERCNFVESFGVMALPMWYHSLDSLHKHKVTEEQQNLGWTEEKRLQIMGWFYQHRGTPLVPKRKRKD